MEIEQNELMSKRYKKSWCNSKLYWTIASAITGCIIISALASLLVFL